MRTSLLLIMLLCANTSVPRFLLYSLFRRFKKIINLFLFYVCVLLHVCMCTICIPGVCRGQKRARDPLELELTVMSCIVQIHVYPRGQFPDKGQRPASTWPCSRRCVRKACLVPVFCIFPLRPPVQFLPDVSSPCRCLCLPRHFWPNSRLSSPWEFTVYSGRWSTWTQTTLSFMLSIDHGIPPSPPPLLPFPCSGLVIVSQFHKDSEHLFKRLHSRLHKTSP